MEPRIGEPSRDLTGQRTGREDGLIIHSSGKGPMSKLYKNSCGLTLQRQIAQFKSGQKVRIDTAQQKIL